MSRFEAFHDPFRRWYEGSSRWLRTKPLLTAAGSDGYAWGLSEWDDQFRLYLAGREHGWPHPDRELIDVVDEHGNGYQGMENGGRYGHNDWEANLVFVPALDPKATRLEFPRQRVAIELDSAPTPGPDWPGVVAVIPLRGLTSIGFAEVTLWVVEVRQERWRAPFRVVLSEPRLEGEQRPLREEGSSGAVWAVETWGASHACGHVYGQGEVPDQLIWQTSLLTGFRNEHRFAII